MLHLEFVFVLSADYDKHYFQTGFPFLSEAELRHSLHHIYLQEKP